MLRAAAEHRGTSLVEIYQNCNVFNDDAFLPLKDPDSRDDATLRLVAGEPLVFGSERQHGVRRAAGGGVELCAADDPQVLVHDPGAEDPSTAFAVSRLQVPTPVGVFRAVSRPTYDEQVQRQVREAQEADGRGSLAELLRGGDTWTVLALSLVGRQAGWTSPPWPAASSTSGWRPTPSRRRRRAGTSTTGRSPTSPATARGPRRSGGRAPWRPWTPWTSRTSRPPRRWTWRSCGPGWTPAASR